MSGTYLPYLLGYLTDLAYPINKVLLHAIILVDAKAGPILQGLVAEHVQTATHPAFAIVVHAGSLPGLSVISPGMVLVIVAV